MLLYTIFFTAIDIHYDYNILFFYFHQVKNKNKTENQTAPPLPNPNSFMLCKVWSIVDKHTLLGKKSVLVFFPH